MIVKLMVIIPLLVSLFAVAQSPVQVVNHKDLIHQVVVNSLFKQGWHRLYNQTLDSIEDSKRKQLIATETIDHVQGKIYKVLNNVQSGLRHGKMMTYTIEYIPKIFENLKEAGTIMAGKPQAVVLLQGYYQLYQARITGILTSLSQLVTSPPKDLLLSPARREEIVYELYTNVMLLHATSAYLLGQCQQVRLQDAIEKIIPFQGYANMDAQIVQGILFKIQSMKGK